VKILVIGGGVAGLSAALTADTAGHDVVLLEQRSFCGGRAYSFTEPVTRATIDNGQHLLMGCYRATLAMLRTIGSEHLVTQESRFVVPLLLPSGELATLDCPNLPAPWHVAAGLLRLRGFPKRDVWHLRRAFAALKNISAATYAQWDCVSVSEWLDQIRQSTMAREIFWTPLTLAIMNETPERASVAPLLMMLREGLWERGVSRGLVVPRVGLSELLIDPAVERLRAHGHVVQESTTVQSVLIENSQLRGVVTTRGITITADAIIFACPPRELGRVLAASGCADDAHWQPLTAWESVPICSVHLWYDRAVLPSAMLGLPDENFHWAFGKAVAGRRSPVAGKDNTSGAVAVTGDRRPATGDCISLVSSACRELAAKPRVEILQAAQAVMQKYFPAARAAKLVHAQLTKELHATVSLTVGSATQRLPTRTPWTNAFLAGDWTQTFLPATIEGAVRSGANAAQLLETRE